MGQLHCYARSKLHNIFAWLVRRFPSLHKGEKLIIDRNYCISTSLAPMRSSSSSAFHSSVVQVHLSQKRRCLCFDSAVFVSVARFILLYFLWFVKRFSADFFPLLKTHPFRSSRDSPHDSIERRLSFRVKNRKIGGVPRSHVIVAQERDELNRSTPKGDYWDRRLG